MTGHRGAGFSRKKRVIFGILLAGGTYLAAELISLAAMKLFYGGWSQIRTASEGAVGPDNFTTGVDYPQEVVHPYLGWVRHPRSSVAASDKGMTVSDYGFVDGDLPFHTRSPGKVIIGILGGSVAERFSIDAVPELMSALAKSPRFAGKEFVFVRLALSGYKQPQQLLVVNYLLTLGAEFDVLINIDGFNEVVLPAVENVPDHVFDAYPRSWHLRMSGAGDLEVMRCIGRIAYLKERMKAWAEVVRAAPLSWSATANLAWWLYHQSLRAALFREYAVLRGLKSGEGDYAASGPSQKFADAAALYEHCAAIWMRSSLQLHQLCAANGIRYYHFLQPNQYVPGSKTMGEQEKIDAWQQGYKGQRPVEGTALQSSAVDFMLTRGACFFR